MVQQGACWQTESRKCRAGHARREGTTTGNAGTDPQAGTTKKDCRKKQGCLLGALESLNGGATQRAQGAIGRQPRAAADHAVRRQAAAAGQAGAVPAWRQRDVRRAVQAHRAHRTAVSLAVSSRRQCCLPCCCSCPLRLLLLCIACTGRGAAAAAAGAACIVSIAVACSQGLKGSSGIHQGRVCSGTRRRCSGDGMPLPFAPTAQPAGASNGGSTGSHGQALSTPARGYCKATHAQPSRDSEPATGRGAPARACLR